MFFTMLIVLSVVATVTFAHNVMVDVEKSQRDMWVKGVALDQHLSSASLRTRAPDDGYYLYIEYANDAQCSTTPVMMMGQQLNFCAVVGTDYLGQPSTSTKYTELSPSSLKLSYYLSTSDCTGSSSDSTFTVPTGCTPLHSSNYMVSTLSNTAQPWQEVNHAGTSVE